MILDRLDNLDIYTALHPTFSSAFAFLQRPDLAALSIGRHEIQGDDLFAIVAQDEGRARGSALLEVHDRYIDIQVVLSGLDEMGWRTRSSCRHPEAPYDVDRDFQFFTDLPDLWLPVAPDHFAIFFPHDAHLPLIGNGIIHKVIVKVAVC